VVFLSSLFFKEVFNIKVHHATSDAMNTFVLELKVAGGMQEQEQRSEKAKHGDDLSEDHKS